MKSAVLAVVVLAVALASPPALAADFAGGTLAVTREEAAGDCPDESALERATLALGRLPDAPKAALDVAIAFRRTDTAYVAELRTSGSTEGVREVVKEGDRCAPLAEAVAVVLAVLFDLTPRETTPSPPPAPVTPPPPPRAPAPPPTRPPPLGPPERSGPRATIGALLSGGAAYGLLGRAVVGTLAGAVRPRLGHFELVLGGLWAPHRTVEYEPGRVLLSLAAARLDACAWLGPAPERPDLALCAGFLAGRLRADGRGYLHTDTANDAWFAFETSAQGRWPLAPNLALQLGISLVVPTRQQSFTVANAGVAFESSPVAGVLELGPELRFP